MLSNDLKSEHIDHQLEEAFLAALSQAEDPADLYYELQPDRELFSEYDRAYRDLVGAIEAEEEVPSVPDEWTPAEEIRTCLDELEENWERRKAARLQEILADGVGGERPIHEALQTVEEKAAAAQGRISANDGGGLRHNDEVLSDVLEEAESAREHYQATGDPIQGVKTGIKKLDEVTGGLQPGLTILSGGPGIGKTTLALQIGADAADEGVPVLYVTFENSPRQLVLKGMGRVGDVNPKKVRRGTVALEETKAAARKWSEKARRLSFIEGRSDLSPGQVRGKARRLIARYESDQCLVIIDYLQLYAKALKHLDDSEGLRDRVERMGQRLREMSMRLRSPVLAISSQSRSAGYSGGGSADLDTLKESGDLEYGADVVAILTEPESRQATSPASPVDLHVAKNRNGETTGHQPLELIFRPDRGTMRPESYHEGAPEPPVSGNGSLDNSAPF